MSTSRISYRNLPDELTIRIPAPKNFSFLIFWPLWWAVWTAVSIAIVAGGEPAAALWLIVALPVSVAVAVAWLWWVFGYEEIVVNTHSLCTRRRLFGLNREHTTTLREVRDLRAAGFFGSPWESKNYLAVNGYWLGLGGGVIAFNQAREVKRFGIYLEEDQAREVVNEMRRFIPAGQ